MFQHSWWIWVGFFTFVILILALDLLVFQRKKHRPSLKEAGLLSLFFVSLGVGFAGVIWLWGEELGLLARTRTGETLSASTTAVTYLTAFVLEESLSMDNVFVFLLLFRYFKIPGKYQHEILFWGIIGAVVFRLTFILLGVTLLAHFVWVYFVFGAILFFTGGKLFFHTGEHVEPEHNPVLRLLKKFVPVTHDMGEGNFFLRHGGVLYATPLFVTLIAIETTDIIFAIDSVPAVLSVTQDLFIAFSSNVFAVIGLRALYFVVAEVIELFEDLHYGLSLILIFIGAKLVYEGASHYLPEQYHLPDYFHWVSLGVVLGTLAVTMLISIIRHRGEKPSEEIIEATTPD